MMVQVVESALSDAGDNRHLNIPFKQPARERAGRVRWCFDDL